MPEPYPLPAHAASFWIAGDDLWIAFPGQGPEGRGHSIRLPASVAGLQTAVNIMKDRAQAERLEIGNRGTPTQYEVEAGKAYGKVVRRHREENEAKLKAFAEARAEEKRAKAKVKEQAAKELQELGL